MFYVISRERLMYEYNYNIRGQNKGIMNWFVSTDGFLNILLDIDNVQYIYRQSAKKVDPVIRMALEGSKSILGVMHGTEIRAIERKAEAREEIESAIDGTHTDFPLEPESAWMIPGVIRKPRKNPKVIERGFYEPHH